MPRERIPLWSWVFPGNIADVSTVETIKKDLLGGTSAGPCLLPISGMYSEDNRKELAKACGKYLLVTRMAGVKKIKETVLEEELKKHKDKSATRKWAINLLASRRYKRYLTITDKDTIRIDDRKAIREAAKYDGKWVLETNDDTISVEDAAHRLPRIDGY